MKDFDLVPSVVDDHPLEFEFEVDIESARQECGPTAEKMAEITTGYGKTAVERYLLRFEYGIDSSQIAEADDVSRSTISKQTMGVRRKLLRQPMLARIVGQLRVSRTELKRPDITDTTIYAGQTIKAGEKIDVKITFHYGDTSSTYSWKYRLEARSEENEYRKHLIVNYLMDAEYGVLLKRRMGGISFGFDSQIPTYQNKRQYSVYTLPHTYFLQNGAALGRSLEYLATYDLEVAYTGHFWDTLKSKLESDSQKPDRSPAYANKNILLDRIKLTPSTDSIQDYAQEKHLRDNLEHILRVYPLETVDDLPNKTIDMLWNGSTEEYCSENNIDNPLSAALETSDVHRVINEKGY